MDCALIATQLLRHRLKFRPAFGTPDWKPATELNTRLLDEALDVRGG
jgi:hypothetical protein